MNGEWRERVCLVTGGAGFIGAHLCEQLLALGARVVVLDRHRPRRSYFIMQGLNDRVDFVFGDVRELQAVRWVLEQHAVDTIFHLAAQPLIPLGNVIPLETLSVNALGTYTVLEAARQTAGIEAFVYASSGAYYGDSLNDAALVEEQSPTAAANVYAPSIIAADTAVRAYARTFKLPTLACRFLNVYGAGDLNFSRLVPRAVRNLMLESPYHFGARDDGRSKLEFVNVRDLARGLVRAAEVLHTRPCTRGEAINLGSGYPVSLQTLTRLLSRSYDGQEREPCFCGEPAAQPLIRYLDIRKAERLLAWRPEIELQEGLMETLAWYRRFWPQLR
ncbi:MAG: SDR family NAD(P)-dependent oxidoreductase [Acidobacteria bacterium]|nr:SDR family NAD(P)-dependent oxidoreductase [Acidobacteriota bacterium]MBI3424388.1 SDR family NAD(P)-dependent oxidoreductase [Acidobacteriota bacterium]